MDIYFRSKLRNIIAVRQARNLRAFLSCQTEQHMCDLSTRQVDAAAQKACGSNKVRRDKFLAVMRGVARRCRASQRFVLNSNKILPVTLMRLRWDSICDTNRRAPFPGEGAVLVRLCEINFTAHQSFTSL